MTGSHPVSAARVAGILLALPQGEFERQLIVGQAGGPAPDHPLQGAYVAAETCQFILEIGVGGIPASVFLSMCRRLGIQSFRFDQVARLTEHSGPPPEGHGQA